MPDISPEDLVRLMYQAALWRAPDDKGLAEYAAALVADPGMAAIAHILQDLSSSREAQDLRPRAPEMVPSLSPLVVETGGEPVKHVFSAGSACLTSSLLQRLGLRPYAGPFDWLFSSLPMVTHCIADGFATFLDRSHYKFVPLEERKSGEDHTNLSHHIFYLENYGVEYVFNHYDMTDPANAEMYARRVERFRAALAAPERTLLVNITRAQDIEERDFAELSDAIARYGRNTELLLIAAEQVEPERFTSTMTALLDQRGPHRLVGMRHVAPMAPLVFEDALDNLQFSRLLRSYPLALGGDPLAGGR